MYTRALPSGPSPMQWKALTRAHAALVAADGALWRVFEQECYSYFPGVVPMPAYVAAQVGCV